MKRAIFASARRRHGLAPGACRPARTARTSARSSKEGFFGPAALFHHRHPPTGWTAFEGPLRPRAFDLNQLAREQGVAVAGAPTCCGNAHVRAALLAVPRASMEHLARNADGDELLFVHAGAGELYCDYGHLALAAGDYVVLPRGTMWRIETQQPLARAADRGDERQLHAARQGPARRRTRSSIRRCSTRRDRRRVPRAAERRSRVAGARQAAQRDLDDHLSVQSARCGRLARRPVGRADQRDATSGRS